MTTSSHAESPPSQAARPPSQRYKRSVKNYLIDSRFQLKYTGLILLVALVISSVLGAVLWRTSQQVIAESDKLVDESKKVVAESQKVSDIVRMSIKDDPVYSQQPELQDAFNAESKKSDEAMAQRQAALSGQQQATEAQQRSMIATLVGGLSLMVVLIGLLGIYFTHKVAGPIYKMKMLLMQVGEGKLPQSRLRKGDELQDFFAAFATMVDRLRARQLNHVVALDQAIAEAKAAGLSDDGATALIALREKMSTPGDAKTTAPPGGFSTTTR
jgi:nitrogen fixation/metabolism regulation signal transduction histidine kinase